YYAASCESRVTSESPKRAARHILRHVKPRARPGTFRILDFGGGDGSISHAAALELIKKGVDRVDIVVTDHDHGLTAPASSAVTLSRASTLEEIPRTQAFHLVIASAVLEHLTRPAETTRSLLSRMEPAGYFYARTPYVVPLLRLLNALRV